MKTRCFSVVVFLLFFSYSCNNKSHAPKVVQLSEFPVEIKISEAIANQKDIKLSEIADSIVYIPLETSRNSPVGYIADFDYAPDNYFILTSSATGILRFNGQGKFLNFIGKQGRGPGEYLPGSTFSVIENPPKLYVLSNFTKKLLEFDFDGNYSGQVLNAYKYQGDFFAITSDRFLFCLGTAEFPVLLTKESQLFTLKDKIYNTLGYVDNPIVSYPELGTISKDARVSGSVSSFFKGLPLFHNNNTMDTIYSVRNDSIYPRYIINKGTEDLAPLETTYTGKPTDRYKYLYVFPQVNETSENLFFRIVFKETHYLICYHKDSQSVSSMKTPFKLDINFPPPVFENDLDGGISLGPGKSDREGNIWIYIFSAINFKKNLTTDHFLNSKPIYPDKKEALKKVVSKVKVDDNPIIIKVYLKNNVINGQ
jgi:hypothetical protein